MLAILVVAIVALTGVYSVDPGEQGVIRTLGRESGKSGPGLHYAFPLVQQVDIVDVEEIRRLEVGIKGDQRMQHEATMLTGDENIVEAEMVVQYRVSDPSKFLFRIQDPEKALRATAEVALRSVVGRSLVDDVITTGREQVAQETRTLLQSLMDEYESGLSITEVQLQNVEPPDPVREAFHDVVRAREEKEQLINEARGYEADILPRAKGEERKIVRAAEAYRAERELLARGEADRFKKIYEQYRQSPEVTRERMFLETLEGILADAERTVVIDGDIAEGSVPLLPLGGNPLQGGGK